MKIQISGRKQSIRESFSLPGDKSIAHRALIIGSLAKGEFTIKNFPKSFDCMATLEAIKKFNVEIAFKSDFILVRSPGYLGFKKELGILDAKNSGTTARLLAGLVSGINGNAVMIGDESLSKRPMERVIVPLQAMGGKYKTNNGRMPIEFIKGNTLKGINYTMPISSAQVKSCILIAGFLSEGTTTVIEKDLTRDHTERMFDYLGVDIKCFEKGVQIRNSSIYSKNINIPGDISSAAFLISLAILSEDSEIKITGVLLNERRSKYLEVLKEMGADIEYSVNSILNNEEEGNIIARPSILKPIIINSETLPSIIDEVPIIAVVASFCDGVSEIRGVNELKYKESNRIMAIVDNLNSCGVKTVYDNDKIIINGKNRFLNDDFNIKTHNDHRIAMAFAAFSIRNLGNTFIDNWQCTNISFVNSLVYFKKLLEIKVVL
jgi:3-phosphoshikimate 1-carboxyvinyltransferase